MQMVESCQKVTPHGGTGSRVIDSCRSYVKSTQQRDKLYSTVEAIIGVLSKENTQGKDE